MSIRLRTVLVAAALTLVAGLATALPASAAVSSRHVEGRVLSVDRDARSFRLRDSERGTFTVYVTRSTRFDRTSFARVRAGRKFEATVRRVSGRWQASKVEPGTGSHAAEPGDDKGSHAEPGDDKGSHAEPGDDKGNHVEPGDDKGGHGNDDGANHS
jgi:hypothetical protein